VGALDEQDSPQGRGGAPARRASSEIHRGTQNFTALPRRSITSPWGERSTCVSTSGEGVFWIHEISLSPHPNPLPQAGEGAHLERSTREARRVRGLETQDIDAGDQSSATSWSVNLREHASALPRRVAAGSWAGTPREQRRGDGAPSGATSLMCARIRLERTRGALRRAIAALVGIGPRFQRGVSLGVSQLLAGDRSIPGRSPDAARRPGFAKPQPAGAAPKRGRDFPGAVSRKISAANRASALPPVRPASQRLAKRPQRTR
jgi:hypothetical protein